VQYPFHQFLTTVVRRDLPIPAQYDFLREVLMDN